MNDTPVTIAYPKPKRISISKIWKMRDLALYLTFLQEMGKEQGDVISLKIANIQSFILNDPDLVKEVLVNHHRSFVKGRALQMAKPLLGEGLLTSEGDFHHRQRRLTQPALHKDRLPGYGEVMIETTTRLTSTWRDGEDLDIFHEMMRITLSIVAKTLLNKDVESEAEEIGGALTAALEVFPLLMMPFGALRLKLPTPSGIRLRRPLKKLDETIYNMIRERRTSGHDQGDLLSMLLMAQDTETDNGRMTDQQVRDEAMAIFLAGHETTAITLTWTWYLLSQHPEIERQFHEELGSVLGEERPRFEHFPQLTYTRRIMAEALRLYPPAYLIGRRAAEDIEFGGLKIPKGSMVTLSPYIMQRDPRYFPNPERFDPDRWLSEQVEKRPKFSFFPFGAGPRACMGEGFAWMEGILLLATMGQKWKMKLRPGYKVELHPLITLRPKNGMPMILERR